jgi:arabinofuranan 3-O-arabinosyltransferase
VLPASSFGTYAWGSTGDEPLQPLARSDWEVRNAIPLTPAAHIRMLDAVEERLARGEGSAGLTRYLARAGISHLVVRNDLDAGAAGATRPVLVQQALRDSPGITRVATFGPQFPGGTALFGRVLDAYLATPRPAVEIYAVDDPAPDVYTAPLAEAVPVVGGPDAVLALEERGVLTDRPAVVVDDDAARDGVMVSDAQLRRERTFGRTGDAVSAGLTDDDPLRLDGPARDYLYPGAEHGESVVRFDGGSVSASSSASDADSYGASRPAEQPYAAIDGDLGTVWRPAERLGEPQRVWWRVESERAITAGTIVLRLADDPDGDPPARLRLSTDAGERVVRLQDTSRPQRLTLPAGTTTSLTIEAVGDDEGRTTAGLAIAEVEVPGLGVTRTVVTPAPSGPASVYAFDATRPAASGCVVVAAGGTRCARQLAQGAEEPAGIDRVFTVAQAAAYDISVTARPRPGEALDALVDRAARPDGPSVTASSSAVPDPRSGGDAALDGDPGTAWVASPSDPAPSLALTWPEPRTFDSFRVVLDADTAASLPKAVRIGAEGLERTAELDADGRVTFPALTTDRMTLSFPLRLEVRSYDPYTRLAETLGVGITELEIAEVTGADAATVVELPCGEGPPVTVDGTSRDTAVSTTLGALRALVPIELRICPETAADQRMSQGEHRFIASSTDTFAVESATLVRSDAAFPAGGRDAVEVSRWDAEHRVVQVEDRSEPELLVVPENTNPGWVATLDGEELARLTVDGWQQGYVLPAGPAGEVRLEFAPGDTYRAALPGGAAALGLLAVLLLLPARRPGPPSTGNRPAGGTGNLAVGIGSMALIGGWAGLGALAVAVAVGWAARRRRPPVLGVLTAASLLAAGWVALATGTVWQSPSGSGGVLAVQLLVLLAICGVVASVVAGRRPRRSGTSPRQWRIGRSTSR